MTNRALKSLTLAASVGAATLLAQPAVAQTTYTDATNEVFTAAGGGILDIVEVELSNNAFDLVFKINVAGNPDATDWGKYLIAFDTKPGGDTLGNGWARPIAMSQGMDYWIGSWVDGPTKRELYEYTTSWSKIGEAPVDTVTSNSIIITVPFATLGLNVGDTFQFDLYSSAGGGGDGAVDALASPNQTISDWGQLYDSSTNLANPPKTYTLTPSPDPTNRVTFQVNMEVPIAIFAADFSAPSAFDTNSDTLYVRGNFNGWTQLPAYQLFQVGPTLYSNTVDVIVPAQSTISYKFFTPQFLGEEETLLSCDAVRTLEITSQEIPAPLAYWSDRRLSDPTNEVTFSVDMSLQAASGKFTNGVNAVQVRGYFNGFRSGGDPYAITMTNNPPPNTNVFTAVVRLENYPVGACPPYKFYSDSPSLGWESPASTGGGDRRFTVASTNQTLDTVYWNDLTPCEVLDAETQVTFSVDMAGATGTDATVYDGTQTIYINGDFIGWKVQGPGLPDWGNNPLPELALTKSPTSDIHSITLTRPAGSAFRVVYKYSMGGLDNEAGSGVNHERYIRTTAGTTSYTMPQDLWINTNPSAPRAEAEIGGLAAKSSAPGSVTLDWIGLPCTAMEGATNVTGPWLPLFEARGVASTNMTVTGNQMYFRLAR